MHDYKKLQVWQESVDLVTEIYKLTNSFPDKEKFGIVSQVRRSAISIPSNISEGAGRNTKGEFKSFLGNSFGSICELETQLIISNNLNYLSTLELERLTIKIKTIQKKIFNLIKSLNK